MFLFPGFDPVTQDWTITLQTPLPTITNTVWIDGYTQAHVGVPFRYPSQESLAVQSLSVLGSPTGGTFTLSTLSPLPVGTTAPDRVQRHRGDGAGGPGGRHRRGNVTVTGGPAPDSST